MLIAYVPRKFGPKALSTIETANKIIREYSAQGFDLTLRQLYYQFVARDVIPNTQRDYKNLGSIINDARLAGLVSWNAIVDRTRELRGNNHWDSPADIVRGAAAQYQIDKWEDQEYRLEVWIEKDALVGVAERACSKLDVSFFSCRGYTSQSEMHEAALRLKRFEELGQKTVIIHLGDHDPSGKDMTRDVQERLALFGAETEISRIALNMDQIRKFRPPPNPAKITDSRAKNYIKEFGKSSWELDALEPTVLAKLIEKTIVSYRDERLWDEAKGRETEQRALIQDAADNMD